MWIFFRYLRYCVKSCLNIQQHNVKYKFIYCTIYLFLLGIGPNSWCVLYMGTRTFRVSKGNFSGAYYTWVRIIVGKLRYIVSFFSPFFLMWRFILMIPFLDLKIISWYWNSFLVCLIILKRIQPCSLQDTSIHIMYYITTNNKQLESNPTSFNHVSITPTTQSHVFPDIYNVFPVSVQICSLQTHWLNYLIHHHVVHTTSDPT